MQPRAILRRSAACILLMLAAAVTAWYGFMRYQVGRGDRPFALHRPSARFFPITWVWEGDRWFYDRLDPKRASEAYGKAIVRDPVLMEAYLALASAKSAQGDRGTARGILRLFSTKLAAVSTWKWQEALLAYELGDDEAMEASFQFILERMPRRVRDACFLASQYWGSWDALADHVRPDIQPVLLRELIASRELTAARRLWDRMEEGGRPAERELTVQLVHALLQNDRIGDAKAVWRRRVGSTPNAVSNGGFEDPIEGMGFGWRFSKHPHVLAERTFSEAYEGRSCLHVRFLGEANVEFRHVSQVVPVEPGKPYRLQFARKARGITTDQGVFVEVSGFGCPGLSVRSTPVLGTRPWETERLDFTVPEACEAAVVRIRRGESLKFDSRITGDYWLDAVELISP